MRNKPNRNCQIIERTPELQRAIKLATEYYEQEQALKRVGRNIDEFLTLLVISSLMMLAMFLTIGG